MGTHVILNPVDSVKAGSPRTILDSIRRIVRALHVSSRNAEVKSGLSGAQLFVLQQLKNGERLSLKEVAERTFTHQSTVSEVVGRLLKAELMKSNPSRDDGRRLELSITPKGRAKLDAAPKTAQEALAEAIHSMAPGRRAQLAELIEELVDRAGLSGERPALFFEGKKSGRAQD